VVSIGITHHVLHDFRACRVYSFAKRFMGFSQTRGSTTIENPVWL